MLLLCLLVFIFETVSEQVFWIVCALPYKIFMLVLSLFPFVELFYKSFKQGLPIVTIKPTTQLLYLTNQNGSFSWDDIWCLF